MHLSREYILLFEREREWEKKLEEEREREKHHRKNTYEMQMASRFIETIANDSVCVCVCVAHAILLWFHFFSRRCFLFVRISQRKRKWAFTWSCLSSSFIFLFRMASSSRRAILKCRLLSNKWADSISNAMYITFEWHIAELMRDPNASIE